MCSLYKEACLNAQRNDRERDSLVDVFDFFSHCVRL